MAKLQESPRDEDLPIGDFKLSVNLPNGKISVETLVSDFGALGEILHAAAMKIKKVHAEDLRHRRQTTPKRRTRK